MCFSWQVLTPFQRLFCSIIYLSFSLIVVALNSSAVERTKTKYSVAKKTKHRNSYFANVEMLYKECQDFGLFSLLGKPY